MNRDRLEGNWKQLKGRVRSRWGEITDDEVQQLEGNYEELQGVIQERYGYTRERAEQELDDWLDAEQA